MKAAYYLTDMSEAGRANTWIIPGAHLAPRSPVEGLDLGQPEGAIPIRCPANSCLLFDRRLYHTATPHWEPEAPVRQALFVGYAHRWLRP